MGYSSDKTLGVNMHTCLATSRKGLVLGVPNQQYYNRKKARMTAAVGKAGRPGRWRGRRSPLAQSYKTH